MSKFAVLGMTLDVELTEAKGKPALDPKTNMPRIGLVDFQLEPAKAA